MRINHNISAINTNRLLASNNKSTSKSLEKLSSGLAVNRAGDNAAGLAISEKMRGQIRGLNQATSNANDGISLIQTAEGGLNETHAILQRMRELAVQSANDTNTDSDRKEIQKEVDQLTKEITRIATDTEFNTKKLLDGNMAATLTESDANMDASVAAGSNLTASGKYTVNYKAVAGHIASTLTSVTVTDPTGDPTTDGTYTHDGTGWKDAGGHDASTAIGKLTINGTPQKGATITVSGTGTAATFTNSAAEDAQFEITGVTGPNGESISKSAFNVKATAAGNAGGITTGNGSLEVTVDTSKALTFHIGANEGQNTRLTVQSMKAEDLGVSNIDLTSQATSDAAITTIDNAINTVSAQRAALGAMQNRLEHTINNLGTSSENLSAAESQIRDVDMAEQMSEFTKNNILTQAATSMLAQANQQPQNVLSLLR